MPRLDLKSEQRKELKIAEDFLGITSRNTEQYVKVFCRELNEIDINGYLNVIDLYKQMTEYMNKNKYWNFGKIRDMFYSILKVEDKCDEWWYNILYKVFNLDMRDETIFEN